MASSLLRTLFLHHDGIVLGATISALQRRGALDWMWRTGRFTMGELRAAFAGCNAGYLHVAARALAVQGWLTRRGAPSTDELELQVTPAGRIAGEALATYADVGGFVFCDDVNAISKDRFTTRSYGSLTHATMEKVKAGIRAALDLRAESKKCRELTGHIDRVSSRVARPASVRSTVMSSSSHRPPAGRCRSPPCSRAGSARHRRRRPSPSSARWEYAIGTCRDSCPTSTGCPPRRPDGWR